jgi:hypothetical protein
MDTKKNIAFRKIFRYLFFIEVQNKIFNIFTYNLFNDFVCIYIIKTANILNGKNNSTNGSGGF